MGQPITVVRKPSPNAGIVRYEINRSLTGMSHERYTSRDDAQGPRPVDELVRRLFDHGGIDAVHVNSSVITVDLAGGSTGEGLDEVIGTLFRFYREGEGQSADAADVPAEADDQTGDQTGEAVDVAAEVPE